MQLARDTDPDLEHALRVLEQRIGRVHARMRFDVEWDYQTQLRDRGANHFPIENSAISARAIALALKLTGLFWRGRRNAERVELRHNTIRTDALPVMFDGFSILQLSDLHCEMSAGAMLRLAELLPSVRYDVCVLTGDFRAATYGPD